MKIRVTNINILVLYVNRVLLNAPTQLMGFSFTSGNLFLLFFITRFVQNCKKIKFSRVEIIFLMAFFCVTIMGVIKGWSPLIIASPVLLLLGITFGSAPINSSSVKLITFLNISLLIYFYYRVSSLGVLNFSYMALRSELSPYQYNVDNGAIVSANRALSFILFFSFIFFRSNKILHTSNIVISLLTAFLIGTRAAIVYPAISALSSSFGGIKKSIFYLIAPIPVVLIYILDTTRNYFYAKSFEVISNNIVFGAPIDGLAVALGPVLGASGYSYPHNVFIELILIGGLLGIFCAFCLFWYVILAFRKQKNNHVYTGLLVLVILNLLTSGDLGFNSPLFFIFGYASSRHDQ